MKCFYSDNYSFPLPEGHPFPMHKYEDAAKHLVASNVIAASDLIDAGLAEEADILRVHTPAYLSAIKNGTLPPQETRRMGFPWSERLYVRARAAVAGTIAAITAARQDGIGCNLAGGTHHAFPDRGEGYCVLNDVAIAIRKLQADEPDIRVIIVDLDAHQGNGTNFILKEDTQVYCYSMHVGANYPSRKFEGDEDIALDRFVKGEEYLGRLKSTLPATLQAFKPDLAIYLGGVDVHEDDRFGQMKLSTGDMHERDRYTMSLLRSQNLPLATVFGGGYNKDRALTPLLHCQTVSLAAGLAGP
ncbi:MAG: histone deacetylase [Cyanobacteria bacterium REEB67]|nr:histone deacetylase [Cyanobacteria bacterium REEB67]